MLARDVDGSQLNRRVRPSSGNHRQDGKSPQVTRQSLRREEAMAVWRHITSARWSFSSHTAGISLSCRTQARKVEGYGSLCGGVEEEHV